MDDRAINQLTSGKELPRMEIINEPLVKIVPAGSKPSAYSVFWTKESELDAAAKSGKSLADYFGLPQTSEAQQYDVYKITPKAPTEVFVSTIAYTSETTANGLVTRTGGAVQYITPNRQLFHEASYVKSVSNLHLPHIHNFPVQAADAAHLLPKVAKGAAVVGTVYGVVSGVNDIKTEIDSAKSNKEQWTKGGAATADTATRGLVTGVAASYAVAPGAALGTAVTPGVGTVVGGIATGGAAAVVADKVYEQSWLQRGARWVGEKLGAVGYDHFSKEGKLQGKVNDIKEEISEKNHAAQNNTQGMNAKERSALNHKLQTAQGEFNTEAERNGRYFEGKPLIEESWKAQKLQNPKISRDVVDKEYEKRIDAGMSAKDAVSGAYEKSIDSAYPRRKPYVPEFDYRQLKQVDLEKQQGMVQRSAAKLQADINTVKDSIEHPERSNKTNPLLASLSLQAREVLLDKLENKQWVNQGNMTAIDKVMEKRQNFPAHMRTQENSAYLPALNQQETNNIAKSVQAEPTQPAPEHQAPRRTR